MKIKEVLTKWKEGIAKITPLQQLESQQKGNYIMAIGYIAGIIVMAFNLKSWWWIEIILTAGLFNHLIMMLGIWQKLKIFRELELPSAERRFNENV